jgi:hypothetical protein
MCAQEMAQLYPSNNQKFWWHMSGISPEELFTSGESINGSLQEEGKIGAEGD